MASYNIVVKKNKNQYIFFLKELSLIHTSKSLSKGYKEIEDKSIEIIENLKKNDLESHIPSKKNDENKFNKEIKNFAIKAIIVSVSITFVLVFTSAKLFENINYTLDNTKIKAGKEFWAPLKENIISLADEGNNVDIESREKIIKSIKTIVDRYKPYVDELKKINQHE
jgi:hypothetical protein